MASIVTTASVGSTTLRDRFVRTVCEGGLMRLATAGTHKRMSAAVDTNTAEETAAMAKNSEAGESAWAAIFILCRD